MIVKFFYTQQLQWFWDQESVEKENMIFPSTFNKRMKIVTEMGPKHWYQWVSEKDTHLQWVSNGYIDGSVQDCSNSIANALELLQSCTKPSTSLTWTHQHSNWYTPHNIECLVQDCSNSSALAMELLQSCTKPSIYPWVSTRLRYIQCVRSLPLNYWYAIWKLAECSLITTSDHTCKT